jgi:hypothetical protein
MTSYSSIPRRCDRAKAYLYFRETINNFLQAKGARKLGDTTRVLLLASLDKGYVEGCAQNIRICGQTVRNHLKQQNPKRLLALNQQTIQKMKRKGALSKPLVLAVDWHDIMYYGDPKSEGVVGAQRKNGSNRAYRFATISVLLNGQRLTLAATPMLDRGKLWHVKYLLEQALDLDLRVKLVLLDRGYFSTEVIRYLDCMGLRYIMHVPNYWSWLKPGIDRSYTTTTHRCRVTLQATFRLVALNHNGKLHVFATNTSLVPLKLKEVFRRRWGIETSYRMIGLFLAKTTSRLYRLRVLYFFLAVVLYNLWVLWNFRRRRIVAVYALKFKARLMLALSWLPDVETGG